jgi:hypothetical protein
MEDSLYKRQHVFCVLNMLIGELHPELELLANVSLDGTPYEPERMGDIETIGISCGKGILCIQDIRGKTPEYEMMQIATAFYNTVKTH